MAKPIEPTPELSLEASIKLLRYMKKEAKNPNPKRIALIRKAIKTKFDVEY